MLKYICKIKKGIDTVFKDIFPMMATHQMELDKCVQEILRKIRLNGATNQSFSITIPSDFTEADRQYIEKEVNHLL